MSCARSFWPKRPNWTPVPDLRQFYAAVELFYPGNRRGAAGPLEEALDLAEQDGELLEVV